MLIAIVWITKFLKY